MNKFIDSKIYKLTDLSNNHCYIGSTIQTLHKRLSGHVTDARKYKEGYGCGSQYIIKNQNYKIELLEAYPCECLEDLHKREQYYIDNHTNNGEVVVNKIKSYISPEQIKENRQLSYQKHRETILQKKREYDKLYISYVDSDLDLITNPDNNINNVLLNRYSPWIQF